MTQLTKRTNEPPRDEPIPENLYDILGVRPHANQDDLDKAYRKQSKKWHPDRNPGDTHAKEWFARVEFAYRVLSDPDARMNYDQYGTTDNFKVEKDVDLMEAMKFLHNTLCAVIDQCLEQRKDIEKIDIRATMLMILDQGIQEAEKEIENLKLMQKQTAKTEKRWKSKKGKDNVMIALCKTSAHGMDHGIRRAESIRNRMKKAYDLLSDCEYIFDKLTSRTPKYSPMLSLYDTNPFYTGWGRPEEEEKT